MLIDHCPDSPKSDKKNLTFQWEEDGQHYIETHLFLIETPFEEILKRSSCPRHKSLLQNLSYKDIKDPSPYK